MWEALSSLGGSVGDWFGGLGSSFANFFSPEAYGQTMGSAGGAGGISDVVRGSSVGGDPMNTGTNPFQGLSGDPSASIPGGGLGSLGDIFKAGAGLAGVGGQIGGILGGSRSPRLDRQQGPEGAAITPQPLSPTTQPLGQQVDPAQARLTAANLQSQGVGEGAVNTDFIKQYLPPEFQSMTPEQLLQLIHQQGQF